MTIRPLDARVLVRRISAPPPSALIIVPEMAVPDSQIGEVVAVGPGKRLEDGSRLPLEVQPGDLVRWGPYNDMELGDDLVMIQEGDIRYKFEPGTVEAATVQVGEQRYAE